MPHTETQQLRIKGSRKLVLRAQELAWAAETPLSRVDWRPNPELEHPGRLADGYLLTLSTSARGAQDTFPAAWLEQAGRNELPPELDERLQRLLAQFRR